MAASSSWKRAGRRACRPARSRCARRTARPRWAAQLPLGGAHRGRPWVADREVERARMSMARDNQLTAKHDAKVGSHSSRHGERRRLAPGTFQKIMNFFPPFLGMGLRVKEVSDDWTMCRVELKLNRLNRNQQGTAFGGSIGAMTDRAGRSTTLVASSTPTPPTPPPGPRATTWPRMRRGRKSPLSSPGTKRHSTPTPRARSLVYLA